jgi:hypothetical protein
LLEVSPSKRQVNIAINNQSALSSVILVLFWYCSSYIIVVLPFLANKYFYVLHTIYIWNTTQKKSKQKLVSPEVEEIVGALASDLQVNFHKDHVPL